MKKIFRLIFFLLFGFKAYGHSEIEIIAATLAAEAGGEGEAGIFAVACVIQNRSIHSRESASKVCLKPHQFSCWNVARPFRSLKKLDNETRQYCLGLAGLLVQKRKLRDSTKGAQFYCRNDCNPSWRKEMIATTIIHNHIFFKA